jgi:hypothetical protein
VSPLPAALQAGFEAVFERLFRSALAPRGRTGEVAWLLAVHATAATGLANGLRAVIRSGGHPHSIAVETALVHGNPYQVLPNWRYGSRSLEIGDLMIVGETYGPSSGPPVLTERQAFLMQTKVGVPRLVRAQAGTILTGPTAQAQLYADWPPVAWTAAALRALQPPPLPRAPAPGACDAAQFGIVPVSPLGAFEALPLAAGPTFGASEPLPAVCARTVRMGLRTDATPQAAGNGWPRIVEDILARAGLSGASGSGTAGTLGATGPSADDGEPADTADPERPFVAIVARTGPQGMLD